jgi:hypothetical protein
MNETGNQFSFTRAAPTTSGRANNHIPVQFHMRLDRLVSALSKALPRSLLGLGVFLCAEPQFQAKGQTPTMNISEEVYGPPGGIRSFNLLIENLAPGNNNQTECMIQFSIPGFVSPSDIYSIYPSSDFTAWTYSFNQTPDSLYTLTLSVGGGDPLMSDGSANNDPLGYVYFLSDLPGTRIVCANAEACGIGPGGGISFAPFQVAIPVPIIPITISAQTNGIVTPNGTVNIPYGDSTNIVATADNGYMLSSILKDSAVKWTNALANNSITQTNIHTGAITNPASYVFTFKPQVTTNGTPLAWLSQYNIADDAEDSDGDGFLNWQEYVADTNPTNALSLMKPLLMSKNGTNTALIQPGTSTNRDYSVHSNNHLGDLGLFLLSTQPGNGSNITWQLTNALPQGFYRSSVELKK